jgi:hypothetical protein
MLIEFYLSDFEVRWRLKIEPFLQIMWKFVDVLKNYLVFYTLHHQTSFAQAILGENTIKKPRGAKVKVLFQGPYMTHVIFVLVYNLKFWILNT